jgi:hypothetical protein
MAEATGGAILTQDGGDLEALAEQAGGKLSVERV